MLFGNKASSIPRRCLGRSPFGFPSPEPGQRETIKGSTNQPIDDENITIIATIRRNNN